MDIPIYSSAGCLNRKQKKFICTRCVDICPEKVFSLDPKEKLKWDKCSSCGLCVSACPSQCFVPGALTQSELADGLSPGQPVSFGCYKEDEFRDKPVECLAGVPWEWLAVVAMYTDVVLYIGHCDECEHSERAELLMRNLERVKAFLGDELFYERVHLLTEGVYKENAVAERRVSRREIFSDMTKSVAKSLYRVAASRTPFLEEKDINDVLKYRRLLASAAAKVKNASSRQDLPEKKTAEEPVSWKGPDVFSLDLPQFVRGCYGCGICEKICPNKAVEIAKEENGKRLIYITPWKCTACGLCSYVCPHGGLSGMTQVKVPYLEKLPYVRVETASCASCGIAIKPDGEEYCPSCKLKNKRPRR